MGGERHIRSREVYVLERDIKDLEYDIGIGYKTYTAIKERVFEEKSII